MLSWAGAPSLSEKGSFQLRRNHLSGPPEGSISRRGALQGCGVAVQERAPGRERPDSFLAALGLCCGEWALQLWCSGSA